MSHSVVNFNRYTIVSDVQNQSSSKNILTKSSFAQSSAPSLLAYIIIIHNVSRYIIYMSVQKSRNSLHNRLRYLPSQYGCANYCSKWLTVSYNIKITAYPLCHQAILDTLYMHRRLTVPHCMRVGTLVRRSLGCCRNTFSGSFHLCELQTNYQLLCCG